MSKTIKVKIHVDEFYPVYYFPDDNFGIEIELSESEYERYKNILDAWSKAQDELEDIVERRNEKP